LFIDARRLLSIAWNGFLTIPIPYLSVVKVCDYALCVPVFLFEGVHGKECLQRSEELMRGHKLRLLRAGIGVGALMSAAVGVVVGAFAAAVPSLPALLMEPQSVLADAAGGAGESLKSSAGDAAMGIFTGTAFDRVWDHGSLTEKWATVILLAFAVLGSFLFSAAVRQLLYVFYRETAARWTPPPPPEEAAAEADADAAPGPVRAFFRKMAFWKKVEEGDLSEAVAARTAELKKEKEGEGKISDASEKTS
jgi:large-conductance mechanosensitive channel